MIRHETNPPVGNRALNALFAGAWPEYVERDFQSVLSRSLGYAGAFEGERLIGFVNVAWDGGRHAFLLDTTVDPEFRRQGVGQRLVSEAIEIARRGGAQWLHVDCESRLSHFYLEACGFTATAAGLIAL